MGWLVLLLLAPFSSVSSNHQVAEGRLVFDCTQVINDLLLDNSSPESISLLTTALNNSDTIYYGWDASVEDFFPDKILRVAGILQSSGWKLGMSGGSGGERTLVLSISVFKSFQYFQRLISQQTIIENQPEIYELLLPEFEKVKLYFNESRAPIIIIMSFSFASEISSCDIFTDPQTASGIAYYAHAMRRVLGSTLGGTAVEYSENQMKCGGNLLPSPVNNSLAMLSIELVTAQRFPESYGLFSELIKSLVEQNENFIIRHSTNDFKRVLRLQLKPSGNGASSSQDKQKIENGYATLLSRFAARWASETGKPVIIIEATEPIISNLGGAIQDIVPTMKDIVIPSFDSYNSCQYEDQISPTLALLIAQRFNLVYFRLSDKNIGECVEGLHRCSTTDNDSSGGAVCKSHFDAPGNNSLKLLIDLDLDNFSWSSNERALKRAVRLFKQYNKNKSHLPIHAFLFKSWISRKELVEATADLQHVSEQFGCTIRKLPGVPSAIKQGNDSALANEIAKHCNLPKLSLVVLDLIVSVDWDWASMNFSSYTAEAQPRLSVVYSGVRQLQARFPGVRVILQIPDPRIQNANHREDYHSLFCDAKVDKANRLVEAFVTWSRIHNMTLILKPVWSTRTTYSGDINSYTYPGWWDRLNGIESSGSRSRALSLAFATRNHPKTMMGYLEVEPCLERLGEPPPRSPIPMFTGGMGATIHVPEEEEVGHPQQALQVMLEFALHKFSRVEIIASNSLEHVIPQLENRLLSSSCNKKPCHIFLQVPLEKPPSGRKIQQSQMIQLSKLVEELKTSNQSETIIRIQISNWGDSSKTDDEADKDLQTFFQKLMATRVQLGVVIANCSSSSGSILEGGGGVRMKDKKKLLHYSSFLVCVTTWDIKYYYGPNDRFNYFSSMATALDQLYLTNNAFRRQFPDKEIYFRLHFNSSNNADFLRTIRAVNQHAELYHLKYFAVNAFDYHHPSTGRGSPSWKQQGWWRVEDGTDLANPFNYVERESEYLSVTPWRPPTTQRKKQLDETTFSWWIFVPLGVGFILAIIAIALLALWKWSKSRLLTRIEELEFLNGVSPDMILEEEHDDGSHANEFFKDMKFDKKVFEIPKINLKSEEAEVIGAGNFGVVYKAVVKGELVAVKIPKEGGCSPALFKTTLQEIKIMCHVGCHENVVRFVGAYIKEIRRGIVQIATELCEYGTLLSHLRDLARSLVGSEEEEEESSHSSELLVAASFDLNRFSLEIASGMEFLSSKRVIHGDLATRNVLLDEHFTCKIGDFGLSRKLVEYETYVKKNEEPLPWRWMAVETLDKREFSIKSDVWSYGVTLWEVYTLGSVPYPSMNWTPQFVDSLCSGGVRLPKPKYSTDELYGKLLDCWNIEPEARPTFSELCNYFRSIREGQYLAI